MYQIGLHLFFSHAARADVTYNYWLGSNCRLCIPEVAVSPLTLDLKTDLTCCLNLSGVFMDSSLYGLKVQKGAWYIDPYQLYRPQHHYRSRASLCSGSGLIALAACLLQVLLPGFTLSNH